MEDKMLEFSCEVGPHYTETLHFQLCLGDGKSQYIDEGGAFHDVSSIYQHQENVWKKWGFKFEYGKQVFLIEVTDADPKGEHISTTVFEIGQCVASHIFTKIPSRTS